jgi:hypothetical protein
MDAQGHAAPRSATVVASLLSISDATRLARISRAQLYVEIGAGRLVAKKVGRRTLIDATSFEKWIAALPTAVVGRRGARG